MKDNEKALEIYGNLIKIVEEEYNKNTDPNDILDAITCAFCSTCLNYRIPPTEALKQLSRFWNNFQEWAPGEGIQATGKMEFHQIGTTQEDEPLKN